MHANLSRETIATIAVAPLQCRMRATVEQINFLVLLSGQFLGYLFPFILDEPDYSDDTC